MSPAGLYALDLHDDDIFWCTADPGWVTGTSYGIIAPLTHGVTNLVVEAEFDAETWYRVLAEERVTVWYTAPTAIRMMMKLGAAAVRGFDLGALRFMAGVGEPLNPEAVIWGVEAFGRPFHDNWWQTETGGIMIANFLGLPVKPGSMGLPLPGIEAAIVERRPDGSVTVIDKPMVQGELGLKAGWPSMMRGYLHEEERYRKCFAGPWYLTSDLVRRDSDGYFWFVGRADDVIKSSGHLIGPFEVESALMEHRAVAEVGVIGKPDPMAGEIVKAFVALKPGFEPSAARAAPAERQPTGGAQVQRNIRIRHFEAKCVELYQAQKILGFLHLYDGEEAVSVGVMAALGPEDAIVATYREHGQAIARGVGMDRLMAEMLGKKEGCCRGRGGSMHIFDRATRFYGGNAIVGGGLPLAIGIALGDKMQGRAALTACFFGEGAVDEGEFHESMNLAALWRLPVLFVCENNLYSMGTALARAEAETDIARKAAAYHMPGVAVDGMDVVAVEAAAREAVEQIRAGGGPQFLECRTYRFRAHSMFDAQAYRTKDEVETWRKKGPIVRFEGWLRESGLVDDEDVRRIETEADAEIDRAVAFAEAGTLEPVSELERFVTMDRVP